MEPLDIEAQIQAIPRDTMAELARLSMQDLHLEPGSWTSRPIHHSHEATAGIYRVSGTAGDQESSKSWSLVLKVVHAGPEILATRNDPAGYDYWRREELVYRSGLLDSLSGGLVAPRCFAIWEHPHETVWLWLEDVADIYGAGWPLQRYRLAAYHLGRFNGSYLVQGLPANDQCLGTGILREHVCRRAEPLMQLIQQPDIWENPLIRRAYTVPIAGRLAQLWADSERLLNAVEQLPQTLCHHDAWKPNLLARRSATNEEQTVAIDWAFTGIGAVGEDLGQMVGATMLTSEIGDVEALQLGELTYAGYVEGLRATGWQGDERIVRFGYAASAALRTAFSASGLRFALDTSRHALIEQRRGKPIAELMARRAATTHFLLDLGDEARALLRELA